MQGKNKHENKKRGPSRLLGEYGDMRGTLFITLIPTLGMLLSSIALWFYFESSLKMMPEFHYNGELAAKFEIHKFEALSLLCLSFSFLGLIGFWICLRVNKKLMQSCLIIEGQIRNLTEGKATHKDLLKKAHFLFEISERLNELALRKGLVREDTPE